MSGHGPSTWTLRPGRSGGDGGGGGGEGGGAGGGGVGGGKSGGSGGWLGGDGGDGGGGGEDGGGGWLGGGGICGGALAQQIFQPAADTSSSETQVMLPSDGTIPVGPEVPQYFTPLTTR